MKFDAVLFDAADTLFTTRGTVGEIYHSVAVQYGTPASAEEIQAAFIRQFRHSGPLTTNDEKEWWKSVVHRVFSDVGMVENFEKFFDEVYDKFRGAQGWHLFPETREVLEDLRARQLKLGVISNFDSRLYSVMDDLDIRGYFDSVTISSETGYAKPQPEIFHVAVRSLDVLPGRILFAGDNLLDDYQAGRNAGLEAFLLDRSGRYAEMKAVHRIQTLLDLLPKLT
jgi:putative hydrolase of the HAD superfamily